MNDAPKALDAEAARARLRALADEGTGDAGALAALVRQLGDRVSVAAPPGYEPGSLADWLTAHFAGKTPGWHNPPAVAREVAALQAGYLKLVRETQGLDDKVAKATAALLARARRAELAIDLVHELLARGVADGREPAAAARAIAILDESRFPQGALPGAYEVAALVEALDAARAEIRTLRRAGARRAVRSRRSQ